MTHHELHVPDESEFLEFLGATATPGGAEEIVRSCPITVDAQNDLTFSYDITGGSVRCRWHRQGVLVLGLFCEGATQLRLQRNDGATSIVVRFELESLTGQLAIQVHPAILVRDELLFA
jgi:hypothetical protein